MRATTLAAGGLACAGAAIVIAAFVAGGGSEDPGAVAQAPAPGNRGQQVFIANGCGSCHTFAPANSESPIGPDLAQTLKGQPREYVRDAILLPNSEAPPGYTTGAMPEDFATRIAPEDLEPLVDFLMAGARQG